MTGIVATPIKVNFGSIASAAASSARISGLTHNFYRYPARFSPTFAAAVIQTLSRPGDFILDPYMGGGTSIVEAVAASRNAVGNDLNSLAVFIARVKTTPLTTREIVPLKRWANKTVPQICYRDARKDLVFDEQKVHNLSIPRGRFIKKIIAVAMSTLSDLPSENATNFARCAILNAGQWALDGRKMHTSLEQFRTRLAETVHQMLESVSELPNHSKDLQVLFAEGDAAKIHEAEAFAGGRKVDLVVTSPPYPGVHMLYHRWQVDGRRETPAPYWIAGCNDGEGASFYNFGGRKEAGLVTYFAKSLETLRSIRHVMRSGAFIVQMIAFNEPNDQLPRYLRNMTDAGFSESLPTTGERIWRDVPSRKWHANLQGSTHSSREVVLIHRAV